MTNYAVFEPSRSAPAITPQESWLIGLVFPSDLVERRLNAMGASEATKAQVRRAFRTIYGHARLHSDEGDVTAARRPHGLTAVPARETTHPEVVGTAEAAAILGITDGRVRQLVQDGTLPRASGSTTRRHLIRRADLLAYLQKDAA